MHARLNRSGDNAALIIDGRRLTPTWTNMKCESEIMTIQENTRCALVYYRGRRPISTLIHQDFTVYIWENKFALISQYDKYNESRREGKRKQTL